MFTKPVYVAFGRQITCPAFHGRSDAHRSGFRVQ